MEAIKDKRAAKVVAVAAVCNVQIYEQEISRRQRGHPYLTSLLRGGGSQIKDEGIREVA